MYSNIALASSTGECLIAVVDRCGSMRGGRLASVRTALHSHVDRLKPQDTLGVVVFDDQALVQVPAHRMSQHNTQVVHQLIEAIQVGGTTDLSAGYLLGLSEAHRHVSSTRAAVVLLSDGHANHGISQADHLADLRIGYVALPDLIEQAITWPLAVNAVPGDEVAGRIPDLTVTTAGGTSQGAFGAGRGES